MRNEWKEEKKEQEKNNLHVSLCVAAWSISARDPSWLSIAIVLLVSIGNSTVVNPRDQHPADEHRMVQRAACEKQNKQARVKSEVLRQMLEEKKIAE